MIQQKVTYQNGGQTRINGLPLLGAEGVSDCEKKEINRLCRYFKFLLFWSW